MEHPYAAFLSRVEKPVRYVGGEVNQVKKDWAGVDVRFALAFPDLYDVGMSHLGMKILYTLLNALPRIACERAFAPWADLEVELRTRQLPLVSLESARALSEFDVVGFSLQYELTYTNVLLMLELGGIPLLAAERGVADPLIIGGGPTATHPEPLADFFDAFLIGDAEERLPELLLRWAELKAAGAPRAEALAQIARLGGIYVPALYAVEEVADTGIQVVARPSEASGLPFPIQRAFLAEIDRFPFPDAAPVPHAEAIFDRMAVEIARGCTEGCRFCQAGMIYRPVRERSPESILATVRGSLERGGYDEVSLTSLSTADYSAIAPLVEKVAAELTPRKVALSVSSLRAYGLPEAVLDDISEVRASGLTFAPEAGTQRMRDVVNKNVSEEDLAATSHRVFARGWDRVKLYFMIGLPTETEEDVRGIAETGARVHAIGLGYHPRHRLRVVVSVSPHVPKPHTPFQWAAFDGARILAEKQELVAGLARSAGLEFRTHDVNSSSLEAIISRGDRRVGRIILDAYRRGARFDSWDEQFRHPVWLEAIAASGVDTERYLGTLPVDARLTWDHIDVGLADGFLLQEYRRALKDRLSPPCGKPFKASVHHTNLKDALAEKKRLICYDCGVACDMTAMREERIAFLGSLDAQEPRIARPLRALESKGRRKRAPRESFDQRERFDARLRLTKLGTAVLEGHLDFIRSFTRGVRRAGLEPWYSQGFHPKPVMVFGPALSLGVPSLAEYADIALAKAVAVPELLERLNAAAAPGVRFLDGEYLSAGSRKLGKLTSLAEYLVAVSPAGWERALARFGRAGESPDAFLERRSKEQPVVVSVRRGERLERPLAAGLHASWLGDADARATELGLGSSARLIGLRLETASGLRPVEVVSALLGEAEVVLGAGRIELLGEIDGRLVRPIGAQPIARPVEIDARVPAAFAHRPSVAAVGTPAAAAPTS